MASVQLHVKPEFNAEEAAHAAADIVGSLENLPGEVSFLLQEIREKDLRIESLITRINTRHYGITKHVKRTNESSQSQAPSTQPNLPIPQGGEIPTEHLIQKESQAIQKIQAEWEKIEILQEEKVKLADRMERIVARARERARAEWVKVGGIDVEELMDEGSAAGGEIVLPPSGLGSGSDVRQKKRKPQALPLPLPSSSSSHSGGGHIFHPPSSSMPPPPAPSRPSLSARSSYAQHPPKGRSSRKSTSFISDDGDGEDMDAEGEVEDADVDAEGVDGAEGADDTPYCVCRKPSHGEMIGCDNDRCEIEWFHIGCVGIKEAPDTWYCPDCVRKLGLSSSDGSKPGRGAQKGRKR